MKKQRFPAGCRNHNHYYNYGHMYEMDWAVEGQQNVALSDTNRLLAGAEFRHASVNNTDFYDEKKSYENRSLYLQDQWELAPTWQLNTGLRYDNYHNLASRTNMEALLSIRSLMKIAMPISRGIRSSRSRIWMTSITGLLGAMALVILPILTLGRKRAMSIPWAGTSNPLRQRIGM